MSFEVGDVVVCVDATRHENGIIESPWRPIEGHNYTLEWVGGARFKQGAVDAVKLVEDPDKVGAWAAIRFRKLQGPCESLTVARMIANRQPQQVTP